MGLTRPRAYQIFDLDYKQSVRVVTVSNITLAGGAPNSVDGVNLSLKDRVLVTGQNTASQNGLYYVTTVGTGSNGTWSRSIDGDQTGEIEAGMIIMVTEGNVYADTQWKLTTNDPIVIGSTGLTFIQNYSTNSISSGTSNVVVTSNANVTISSAGTANVFTVSSTGTVTSGTASATGNVIGSTLRSTNSVGDEGGEIQMSLAAANTTLTGGVTLDVYQNRFRIFETGGTNRGGFFDLSAANAGASTNFGAGGGGGGTPGGANTQIQFNDAATFGGSAGFTFNKTTNAVATTGTFSATGNIDGGNIRTAGLVTATGNVSGNYILGNGALLTGVITSVANINNGTSNVTVVSSGGNVTVGIGGTANVAVFATTGQFITGVSSVSGNITGGNVLTGGLISATGTITSAANITGGNILTGGIVSATGNITGGNILGGANVNATTHTGTTVSVTANITGGNILTGGIVSATGNITGGNVLTGGLVSATGAITGSSLSVSTGNISCGNINNNNANGVGNIGNATTYFNTVFAKATSAQYADLAEMYVADANYKPGTVVEFGGVYEITVTTSSHSTAVAGIVSTNPSYLMNSTQTGEHVLPIALTGRVPCQVLGPVNKGDVLVSSNYPGVAQRIGINWQPGCVLGKAMEQIDTAEVKVIEVAVGRL